MRLYSIHITILQVKNSAVILTLSFVNFHSTFDPNLENPQKALEKYKELKQLEHEHGNKFSGKSLYYAMSSKTICYSQFHSNTVFSDVGSTSGSNTKRSHG